MPFWSRISGIALLGLAAFLSQRSDTVAAELKLMTPRSMWTVLMEIGPQFERESGYKLNVVTDIAASLADRIIDGETFDIFIGPPAQMNRVINNNKVMANTVTAIFGSTALATTTNRLVGSRS